MSERMSFLHRTSIARPSLTPSMCVYVYGCHHLNLHKPMNGTHTHHGTMRRENCGRYVCMCVFTSQRDKPMDSQPDRQTVRHEKFG
mmetsp:Transcript_45092/g.127292  ORF Transcript_45092/g.127292 Transcript_45092/m.127292 type:complete len:86 (+) Transcript_45092:1004-1261(+)